MFKFALSDSDFPNVHVSRSRVQIRRQVFERLVQSEHFEYLRATRHFGALVLHLVLADNVDPLMRHLLRVHWYALAFAFAFSDALYCVCVAPVRNVHVRMVLVHCVSIT